MDYGFRLWHDRKYKKNRRKGRTIAVIWDGDERYVGVAECGKFDQFVKARGFHMAVDRAEALRDCGRPERFPYLWHFHMEETLSHEKAEFLKSIPTHLYKEERQANENAQADRPQFA